MGQTVFYSEMDDFCRKYFVVNDRPAPSHAETKAAWIAQEQKIFEQLMLFDKICFKVKGESILIGVLNRMLGEKGFSALLDQGAMSFVLWDQEVVYLEKNIPGIEALASMKLSNGVHADPHSSIEAGLVWWNTTPQGWRKKKFVRKLAEHYDKPNDGLAPRAIIAVKNAARNGRLTHCGFDPVKPEMDSLSTTQKQLLAKCAQDFLEYGYLQKHDMTSFSEYKYFSPFWDVAERFQRATGTLSGFAEIATMENLPNMRALHGEISQPMVRLATLRQSHNAVTFRKWLSETAGSSPDVSVTKAYLNEITERKSVFNTFPAKLLSKVALATFGTVLGAKLSPWMEPLLTATGAPWGAAGLGLAGSIAASPLVERIPDLAADVGVELFDSYAIERLTKGWIPRMFVSELDRLRHGPGQKKPL